MSARLTFAVLVSRNDRLKTAVVPAINIRCAIREAIEDGEIKPQVDELFGSLPPAQPLAHC